MDIAVETVCYVINRAREVMADLDPLDDEPGRHAGDDLMREELPEEDDATTVENPELDDLKEYIDSLNEDEQAELVALTWIGRGTYTAEDWDEAVEVAHEEHPKRVARYLLSQPLLADELEEGLAEMGFSCEDAE
ncbi:MAG: DUF3775 domain-containing protein [Rhodospirillaceae bacterium]|nr:DUF3775 domain-containing protein [Rhodospirillaceae bacterium]